MKEPDTDPPQPAPVLTLGQRITSWLTVIFFIIAVTLFMQTNDLKVHPIALYVLGFALACFLKLSYYELLTYTVITTTLLFFVRASYSLRAVEAPIYGAALLILCYVSGETYRKTTQLNTLRRMIHKEHKPHA